MTLIETMVVIAILSLLFGTVAFSAFNARRAKVRTEATRLAAAVRYCYDRAVTTNGYYRVVLDFDNNTYWAEHSEERALLSRDKEKTAGKGQSLDVDSLEKERDEELKKEEEEMRSRSQGLGIALEPPPRAKRAKFSSFTDATIKQVKMKGVRLVDAYTPRQPEPYKKGKAYLYFFPDGHTERALVHLSNFDDEDYYSLLVSPLTGQVEIHRGNETIDKSFDDVGKMKGEVPNK